MESQIQTNLGQRWSEILTIADLDREGSDRRALILLFSHLLRIAIPKQSLHKGMSIYCALSETSSKNHPEQLRMLLQLPQLLSALLTISTSRSWLLPTLSIMRLHAYLAQAVVPGDDRSRLIQLPGILAEDVKELESQVAELEDLVNALGMKDDNRVRDIKKAAQHWGRIELVEASFKGWPALGTRGYPLMIAPCSYWGACNYTFCYCLFGHQSANIPTTRRPNVRIPPGHRWNH